MRSADGERRKRLRRDHEPAERPESRGTPGRVTLTGRLPPSAGSIARAVASELRGPVQARGELAGDNVHGAAAHGLTGSAGSLPFLDAIQRAFGHHDVSGVRAHVGGPAAEAAAALGASAYAAGDAVAFARDPDLHLAAHEAAHVVQQRGGVRLSGGIGRAGDEYERHADAVADLVVRGQSAEALLDPFSHRGPAGGPAVQRRGDDARATTSAGLRALELLIVTTPRPTAAQIAPIVLHHREEARQIRDRVRDRLGEGVARDLELEVGQAAPELVVVFGSRQARTPSPLAAAPGLAAPLVPAPTAGEPAHGAEAREGPVEARRGVDGRATAELRVDEHARFEAEVEPELELEGGRAGEADGEGARDGGRAGEGGREGEGARDGGRAGEGGREGEGAGGGEREGAGGREGAGERGGGAAPRVDLQFIVEGGGEYARAEAGVGVEPGERRAHATLGGELGPTGDRGPTLHGEATASLAPGEDGGVRAEGEGRVQIRIPLGDRAALQSAVSFDTSGRASVQLDAELYERVRALPEDHAARAPLLQLFVRAAHDPHADDRVVGGVSGRF